MIQSIVHMYKVQQIRKDQVAVDMLDDFDRRQEVTQRYYMENNQKKLESVYFIDDWTKEVRRFIVNEYFMNKDNKPYYTSWVYNHGEILGFMVLDCSPIGEDKDYIELVQLQVARPYRQKGIGRLLFEDAVNKTRQLNFKKIYISAHSSCESQRFYEKMGCINAQWLSPKAVEQEPYDIQMEYRMDGD